MGGVPLFEDEGLVGRNVGEITQRTFKKCLA